MRIAILSVGPVDGAIVEEVRCSLIEVFPNTAAAVLIDALPLPDEAYNHRRSQYHSSRILSHIKAYHLTVDVDRMLGVTEADLYIPGLNFVFDEALHRKGPAVISLFRLRPEYYCKLPNKELYLERASKEAVNEVGLTLSLGHCRDPRCVMFFSNSILDTDRKNCTFCEDCYLKLLSCKKA